MRILVSASGGEGHFGPLLPFVSAAHAAGDELLLVIPPEQEATARSTGCFCVLTAAPDPDAAAAVRRAMESADRAVRTHAAEVDLFGRLHTEAELPAMENSAAEFEPDLILREPCDYASAIIAVQQGFRMAQVGISPGRADISGLRMAG